MKEIFALLVVVYCGFPTLFADDFVIDTSLVTEATVGLGTNVPDNAKSKGIWQLKAAFSTQLTEGRAMGERSFPYFLRMIKDYPMVEFKGYPDDVLAREGAFEDFRGSILMYTSERRLLYGITLGFLDTITVSKYNPKTRRPERSHKLLWVDCERIIMELCRLMHVETGTAITIGSDGKVTFDQVDTPQRNPEKEATRKEDCSCKDPTEP